MSIQSRLFTEDARNGNALDQAARDPALARKLLRQRRQLREAIEGLRSVEHALTDVRREMLEAIELATPGPAPQSNGHADDARFSWM
jgi:hypothetical protein